MCFGEDRVTQGLADELSYSRAWQTKVLREQKLLVLIKWMAVVPGHLQGQPAPQPPEAVGLKNQSTTDDHQSRKQIAVSGTGHFLAPKVTLGPLLGPSD